MPTTTLPGFADLTRDSQQSFRALLTALAEPGKRLSIPAQLAAPAGLNPACAAACLTLIDFETAVWLSPTLPDTVKNWLRFHTGCTFTREPMQCTFAIINDIETTPFTQFCWGSAETPEDGATLLIQIEQLQTEQLQTEKSTDKEIALSGPGILHSRIISPAVPSSFWQMWQQNQAAYPMGIDCFLFSEHQVMGLPRSTQVKIKEVA